RPRRWQCWRFSGACARSTASPSCWSPVVITVSACSVLLAMGWAGRLSQPELWTRWLALVGVAAGGVLLGHRWARHVSPAALRKLICGLLVVSGLTLVVHTLQQG
ncbi:hypothetical protein WLU70_04200, partial [Bordetella bronchiseptica]